MIEKVTGMGKIRTLKKEWDSLLERSETNTIFLTFEWISIWWKFFSDGRELYILLIKNNEGELKGIAPFMITEFKIFGIGLRKLEFIGTPESDYCDFIISKEEKEGVLGEIYRYLSGHKNEWSLISLKEIPESSSTLNISKKILKSFELFVDIQQTNVCPTIILKGFSKEEIKKRINRKDVRYNIRRLERMGNLSFEEIESIGEADKLFDKFFEQHIKRWSLTSTPSIFHDERYRDFYRELAGRLMQKKWLKFFVLRFNKESIAFLYDFLYNNIHGGYTTTFDIRYGKYSPGIIAMKFSIEKYISENSGNLDEYDLSRGGDAYKFRFSNKVKRNFKINVYKNLLSYELSRVFEKMKPHLTKNEKLRDFLLGFKNKFLKNL